MTSSIHIESLKLSHFRSHASANFSLDGRPVAVWGKNGAGKTNILEAISMLSPGRGLRRASADQLARQPENIGWKVKASVTAHGAFHDIETAADASGKRTVLIDQKQAPQIGLSKILRMVWLVPSMDRLWIEAAEGRRRFLDRMVLSFEPSHAQTVLSYEKAMRERNRLLKDMVRDPSWYLALERSMAQDGAQITANRKAVVARLSEAQAQATSHFPTADLQLTSSDDTLMPEDQSELENAYSDNRSRDIAAGRTLIGPHRADLKAAYEEKNMPADQCSTGEQKALLISLILANARALKEDVGAAPILLLDEVAAHLDADRCATLFDEIVKMQAQAFMTGTGAELFDALGSRAMTIDVDQELA